MPARFVVRPTPSVQTDLEDLPAAVQEKVLEVIKHLETSPFGPPPRIKRLKGKSAGPWRLEAWPYRGRDDIVGQTVVVYRVRHRKDIYRE
jgi:mRNA-degrading endonuclease RelE of RelBE toxin-antitoxin system